MELNKYPLFTEQCRSLLKKHLTREVFDQLKDRQTANGYQFMQVINSGVINQDSHVGVYAGDAESYDLFSALFDPIIADYHDFSPKATHRGKLKFSPLDFSNPDPQGCYIRSTRIRVARNLANMPLGPALTNHQRQQIESQVVDALISLTGDLQGTYYPLSGLSEIDRTRLVTDHFLFKQGDRFLDAAGLNRDWPQGRGVFHNQDKTFLVWVNEEDQLRIISMEKGSSFQSVFSRLVRVVNKLETKIPFSFHPRLGCLTSCPSNLGTSMRASVHICLPRLSLNRKLLQTLVDRLHLQIRGVNGEHTESEGDVFDISNRRRLGLTEVECLQDLHSGVSILIAQEKKLKQAWN